MKPKNTCAISLSVTKCSRLALVSLASCSATLLWAGPPGETDGASVLPLPLRVNATTRMSSPAWPSPGLTLHVAPRGNDTGDGSAKKPFASLERARDEIRARRKSGSLPGGGVAVLVHGGEYQVSQTFLLSESDSGTEAEPLVFRAVAGEKPIFRGGTRLMGWRKLSDADGYPQLPSESRPKVWIMDLHGQGITNLLPLKLGGFASGNGFRTHPAHELFFNGQAMSLARGPNEGFLHISQVAVKDGTKGYECEGSKTGKFYCDSDRLRQWVNEPDLLLYGYWFWDWADSYERVATIDPEQRSWSDRNRRNIRDCEVSADCCRLVRHCIASVSQDRGGRTRTDRPRHFDDRHISRRNVECNRCGCVPGAITCCMEDRK